MNLENLIGKYKIWENDFVKIKKATSELTNYTYLGRRNNIRVYFDYKGREESVSFIEGYDEIDAFDEINLEAKAHRYMSMLSDSESCYLIAKFYENIIVMEDGERVLIIATPYTEDGNFGIREYGRKVIHSVPKRIVEGTVEEIKEYIKKRR